jgi:hypothetical protein
MSICVALNLSDGVVIAVDSATTMIDPSGAISKVFLDADKLFQLGNLKVGIATYGVAALHARTIGSFIREFSTHPSNADLASLDLHAIVERLRIFFLEKYISFLEEVHSKAFADIPDNLKGSLGLVVGGFSPGKFQSELWEIITPTYDTENSARQIYSTGNYGIAWFASALPIYRYIKGIDPELSVRLRAVFEDILGRGLTGDETGRFGAALGEHQYRIETAGMPIQSGIACARFLIDFVLGHYRFAETHPIVGGVPKIGVVAYDHSAFRILG